MLFKDRVHVTPNKSWRNKILFLTKIIINAKVCKINKCVFTFTLKQLDP